MLLADLRQCRRSRSVERTRPATAVLLRVALPVVIAALGATGCESQAAANREPHAGTTTATAGSVQNVVLDVGGNFRFSPSTVTVHPGKVTITLKYVGPGGAPHDWQLTGFPTDYVPLTSSGQTHSTSFVAPAPGKYSFVCTIHVRQGQTGTLIVLPS